MAVIQVGFDPSIDPNERGYTPPPEGVYQLEIEEVTAREPKAAGKHGQLQVKATIIGSFNNENINKKVTDWISMSPKSTPYFLIPLLNATGVNYESYEDAVSFDTDELIGTVYQADCSHDTYNDKVRDRWGNYEVSTFAGEPAQPAPQAQQARPGPRPAPQAVQQPGQGAPPPRTADRRRVG